ncbi:3-oxoacyl-ACP synthase [Sphingomonas sp. GlSt437]|uniref:3-oxoacyl-ACP synthase n=1 Tax=Sphingomonas sp. GlSt437 TaxID=3389970 RepID=UPI003A86C604
MNAPRPFCFRLAPATLAPVAIAVPRLGDAQAEALAVLVPLLGCGEEAAALAFDGLADAADDDLAAPALALIADEERVHEQLLSALAAALPPTDRQPQLMRAARRFHIDLGRGSGAEHLARIAGIDAAVCTILSRMLRPDAAIGADPVTRALFGRIHRDEARHVRVSRTLARSLGSARANADVAAGAREALAGVLGLAGAAFDTLGVDPDALLRDIGRLPDGLFAA